MRKKSKSKQLPVLASVIRVEALGWEEDEALPIAQRSSCQEVVLWLTVIKQALVDHLAQSARLPIEKQDATRWLYHGGKKMAYEDFMEVCCMAGLSPAYMRYFLLRNQDNPVMLQELIDRLFP